MLMNRASVRPERAHYLRQIEQRRRADVGAMRVAEEHQRRMPLQRRVGNRLAVLIDQLERPADRRRPRAAGKVPDGEQDRADKQHEPRQERRDNQENV
jgi:hypothetical protein